MVQQQVGLRSTWFGEIVLDMSDVSAQVGPDDKTRGARSFPSFEEVADILGNLPEIVRKHYAKWSPARQSRIDDLMERVHSGADYGWKEKSLLVQ
jgi:hypothetical protein